MNVLILGASGRTGRHAVYYALKQGYTVNCLVRDAKKVKQNEHLMVFEGNAINPIDLEKAMLGCSAVINVLNISRENDFPWSKLRTPKDYLSNVMAIVLKIVARTSVQRIIVCSAWGVADTRKHIPFWFRWTIDFSNIKYAYQEHENQEELLTNSFDNWTIVRPTGLLNSKKRHHVRESFDNEPKPRLTIGRKSVAAYLVDCLKENRLIGKKVVISKE